MFDSNVNKGIVAGIIAWLIVFLLLQPLLGYVAPLLGTGAGMLASGITNNIYTDAARGPSGESADFLVYTLAVTGWAFVFTGVTVGILTRRAESHPHRKYRNNSCYADSGGGLSHSASS